MNYDKFVIVKYLPKPDSGKVDKLPIDPTTLQPGNHQSSALRMPYQAAKLLSAAMGDGFGFGYSFDAADGLFFVDIDNCLTESGKWSDLAVNLLNQFPTAYREVSYSGRGLHIIGKRSEDIEHGCKNVPLGIELYTSGRFVALTENQASGSWDADYTPVLKPLIDRYFKPSLPTVSAAWTNAPADGYGDELPDDELISKLSTARSVSSVFNGSLSLSDLWAGNIPDDYDRSSADMSLATHLMWWTGGNCEQTIRLMRRSGLVRDKWDRPDYLPKRTIPRARSTWASNGSKFYQRPGGPVVTEPPVQDNDVVSESGWDNGVIAFRAEDRKSSGTPKGTLTNFRVLMQHFKITLKYDVIAKEIKIIIPGTTFFDENEVNDAVAHITSLCEQVGYPTGNIKQYINAMCGQNVYNPALDWVKSKPWDGADRIPALIESLDAARPEIADMFVRKWLATAMRALTSPDGVAAQGMLVLQGAQNQGKTRWFKSLVGNNQWLFGEGLIIDPSDKDSVRKATTVWIAEAGELDATMRKSDIAHQKSFITSPVDIYRRPYASAESRHHRRTVFCGTVNPTQYLHDPTGNRRFWTISVGDQMTWDHGLDVQQLWAQVYETMADVAIWLTPDELAIVNEINQEHEQDDEFIDALLTAYNPASQRTRWMTITEIRKEMNWQGSARSVTADKITSVFGQSWRDSSKRRVFNMPPLRVLTG